MHPKRRLNLWLLLVVVAAILIYVVLRPEPAPRPRPTPPRVAAQVAPRAVLRPPFSAPRLVNATIAKQQPSDEPCLRGRVRSRTTALGIARAEVTLETPRGAQVTLTDPEGDFELRVPEGVLRLASVSATGFYAFRPEWGHSPTSLTAVRGACVEGLNLFLTPKVPYRGHVVAPAGATVGEATVTIHGGQLGSAAALAVDPSGDFAFEAPDDAVLVAQHPRTAPGRATVDLKATITHEVTIHLGPLLGDGGVRRAQVIAGQVVDGRDAGVPAALVTLATEVEHGSTALESTESDADGRFSFTAVDDGPWVVFAERDGLVPAEARTSGEPVVLRLSVGATLTGTVRTTRGSPVSSFAVVVTEVVGTFAVGARRATTFVDATGRFEVRGLEPAVHEVVAMAPRFASSAPVRVDLSGSARQVELVLHPGAEVIGQVVDRATRRGLFGARVALEGAADDGDAFPVVREAWSSIDGSFTLGGVPPGRHSLMVVAPDHHARLVTVADLGDEEIRGPLTIDLGAVAKGEEPQLELVGIGAVLQAKGDALIIREVMPRGGAAEVGLVPGDGVLRIDGASAADLGFSGGIERIRGPEDTTVALTVRRVDGSVIDLAVPRRRVQR